MPFDPAVIRASFAVVERRADHLAKYFYTHLFAHNPEFRAMFPAAMAEQRDRLFAALTELVGRADDSARFAGYLRTLGRDHRKFRTAPEHYPAVGTSLIAAVRHFSGHSWTAEIEKAWTEAYTVISQAMIAAAAAEPAGTPAWWEAQVTARRRAAPDVVVLTLAPDHPYPYRAGQYLSLCSPRQPEVWRPYSIANAPRADGTLELHVRRVPDGLLSTSLVNDVLPGERLRIGAPLGDCVLEPHPARPLLAVAGGTGWAQIKALIDELAAQGRALCGVRRTTVFLAARSEADQYDLPAVRELAARHDWLDLVLATPAPGAGRERASELLRDGLRARGGWAGHDIHLSGPPDLAPEITELLLDLGAEPELIRHDPVPLTLNRKRPLTSSEWFLDQRDIAWINRTDLG
ncbi:globin domain-containing protein [Kitasatospora sp. MAP5-34]|uniref:globin domain-containing protein n=1 Tax=Kitasatospora sp. MAP5-34 TaxID=3035102 RepID=UPI0024732FBC|nr:globin domain-containing protein [Kitasatospora sp. MAP5-34]MDH6576286.1 NAD(P)H-flavin reductase/hemoglobin-like flavoprotein [Kitasatospora sp. MAP5-34]